jgi:ankyrin repeat protein
MAPVKNLIMIIFHLLLAITAFTTSISASLKLKPTRRINRNSFISAFFNSVFFRSAPVLPSVESEIFCEETSMIDRIPEVCLGLIIEFLYTEYPNLRLVSRDFKTSFDWLILRMARMDVLPPEAFQGIAPYKLIQFAIGTRIFHADFPFAFDGATQLNDMHELSLDIIQMSGSIHGKLLLISSLLKLEVIQWPAVQAIFTENLDPFNLPASFSPNLMSILAECWRLGLVTVAKHLACDRLDIFARAVEEGCGVSIAIRNKHHSLARFMITQVNSYNRFVKKTGTTKFIIESIIEGEYWDIMITLFDENPRSYFRLRMALLRIAEQGSVSGLSYFRQIAHKYAKEIVFAAASRGHLDFLKELHLLGILLAPYSRRLNNLGETVAHVVAFHGHLACLQYILQVTSAGGLDYLSINDFNGFSPIYSAVISGSDLVLMEIIKHDRLKNARSSSPHNFYNENASPLQTAISFSQLSQAKVLLSFYPEMINCRNSNGSTIIHTAVLEGDAEALEFLLRHASARLIRAVDDFGCTAPILKLLKCSWERIFSREKNAITLESRQLLCFASLSSLKTFYSCSMQSRVLFCGGIIQNE